MDNKEKCKCVPSGRCHSDTLIGCPHYHYFNNKNEWVCDLDGSKKKEMMKYESDDDLACRSFKQKQIYDLLKFRGPLAGYQ